MASAEALATVALDQRRWSKTANSLKASIERARWMVLSLAVIAAIAETWGAQIHERKDNLATVFGYAGAAALGVAAVIRQRLLGRERTQAWIMARAGSESFKREIYLFCTSSGQYASSDAASALLERRDQILSKLQPYLRYRAEPTGIGDVPCAMDAAKYLEVRITGKTGQIPFFIYRAERMAMTQRYLTCCEFLLAVTAALMGAAVTITGKQAYGAWVAVMTTLTSTITSHVLAQRYEQLAINYRAAADRLSSAITRWQASAGVGLPVLVQMCEDILADENQSWVAGSDEVPIRSAPQKRVAEV